MNSGIWVSFGPALRLGAALNGWMNRPDIKRQTMPLVITLALQHKAEHYLLFHKEDYNWMFLNHGSGIMCRFTYR